MSMRKELGDFDEYSSGVIIGRYLSSIDLGWMDKLKEGVSMMGILSERCGHGVEAKMLLRASSMPIK